MVKWNVNHTNSSGYPKLPWKGMSNYGKIIIQATSMVNTWLPLQELYRYSRLMIKEYDMKKLSQIKQWSHEFHENTIIFHKPKQEDIIRLSWQHHHHPIHKNTRLNLSCHKSNNNNIIIIMNQTQASHEDNQMQASHQVVQRKQA